MPEDLSQLLDYELLDNPLLRWLLALLTALLVQLALLVLRRLLSRGLARFAGRTETAVDDSAAELVVRTRLSLLAIVALWAGSEVLVLPEGAENFLAGAAVLAALLQIGIWSAAAIDFWVDRYRRRRLETDAAAATTVVALRFIGKLVLFTVLLLVALDNVGIDITALVTGVGVAGIAIGLALQNVLGDLFASLSIVIDKPFVIGDFVVVGDFMGNVENIGLKTTRVRSLSGEQLVFSNGDLLSSRIRNFKRMAERRILFGFGVLYQTPAEKVAWIPEKVREIIEARERARFDRAHFKGFGDSALLFEVVYYVTVPDYAAYMDVQQAINLELMRSFEAAGVEFAYPTRTLYVVQEEKGGGDGSSGRVEVEPPAADSELSEGRRVVTEGGTTP